MKSRSGRRDRRDRSNRSDAVKAAAPVERVAAATEEKRAVDAAPPVEARPNAREMIEWLFMGYLALLALGFVLLRMQGVTTSGNEIGRDRAAFMAINAGTLTGFQLHVGVDQFMEGGAKGPLALLALTMGGTFFALAAGGTAGVRILRLPYRDGQVLRTAGVVVAAAAVLGAIPLLGGGRSGWDAIQLSAAAFGNSGMQTGPLPSVVDPRTHLVLVPLMLLGGLGLPVLMDLFAAARRRRAICFHTRAVVLLTAGLYAGGTLLLLVVRQPFWIALSDGLSVDDGGWTRRQAAVLLQALASSSVAAVNARTGGLPFEFVGALPRPVHWVLMALMLIGAHSASAGGGLRPTALLQLGRGVRNTLTGRSVSRAVGIAAVWVGSYLALVAVGFVVMLLQAPEVPADQLLFLTLSAASNVGLSHEPLSLVRWPLATLSIIMLLGRLLPLVTLWWMATTVSDAELLP